MPLAVCLIVKDSATTLRRCLESVSSFADEVVVYDTGSTDATMSIARELGATVIAGYWDDDFARARNDALAAVTSDLVLSLDADEYVVGDPARLRAWLTVTSAPLASVEREDHVAAGPYSFRTPRLFRRDGARWVGRVHEDIRFDGAHDIAHCPSEALRIVHDGYADPGLATEKARRNAAIGLAEIDELRADPTTSPARMRGAMLDLGRSLVASGELPSAAHAFEVVRLMGTGDDPWARATDHLIRTRLQTGEFDEAQKLTAELRDWGADENYCNWLFAQALAQTGSAAKAANLLGRINDLRDPSGHVHDLGQVVEFRALAQALAGDTQAAVTSMLTAMTRYGRVVDRGQLVREWWAPRPLPELLDAVRRLGGPYLDATLAALAS